MGVYISQVQNIYIIKYIIGVFCFISFIYVNNESKDYLHSCIGYQLHVNNESKDYFYSCIGYQLHVSHVSKY